MYQPDAIASYTYFGLPYYVTANEGDARERDGCEEEDRVGDLGLDPTAFPNADELEDDAALGRLNVSTTTGDPTATATSTASSRSARARFSILGPLGGLLWDSGSQLERIAAAQEPERFNFSNEEPGELDERSDSKGPEPEGVDVGTVGFRTYAFVASERQGGIYAYRLRGPSASFEDYLNARPDDLGPEGVQFVPRADSPTGRAMLLVTNEISGTVTAIDVAP